MTGVTTVAVAVIVTGVIRGIIMCSGAVSSSERRWSRGNGISVSVGDNMNIATGVDDMGDW